MQPERTRASETADSNDLFDSEASEAGEADENSNDSSYNQLLFFNFECMQDSGVHIPNVCVVQDEAGDEHVFQGENTKDDFCQWLHIIFGVMMDTLFYNICIKTVLFPRLLCVGLNF